jgi:hypothetical protein
MKTPEDEAFDELAKRQGSWGGGFPAKRKMAADKQREWVGLTDDELADLWYKGSLDWMEFAHAHEAALKEKNS